MLLRVGGFKFGEHVAKFVQLCFTFSNGCRYFFKFRFKRLDPLVKAYIFSLQRDVSLLKAAYLRHEINYILLNFRVSLLEFRFKFRRYRTKILFHLGCFSFLDFDA